MYETYTTIGLTHMNEMLYLKGGRTQQNKQTHQVCQIYFILFVLDYIYIFLFLGKRNNITKS